MTVPFVYPSTVHERRHGPQGYSDYASFRPWLRDEFAFCCVYCRCREAWYRRPGMYVIEHFQPVALEPALALHYDNLLYACVSCNAAKGAQRVADPLRVLLQRHLTMDRDGRLHSTHPDVKELIDVLGLNSEPTVEFRSLWMGIVRLAQQRSKTLYQQLLGYPDDLPNLAELRPPDGNMRPDGIVNSYYAQRENGTLEPTY